MYKNILVPVDVAEEELTNMVAPHVENLAKLQDSRIHFLAVFPAFPYYGLDGAPSRVEIEDLGKKATMDSLDEIIKRFRLPDDRVEQYFSVGLPKDEILKLAEVINADLIIVGSRRPSILTYLLGSTAAAVVRYAKTSVLVVR